MTCILFIRDCKDHKNEKSAYIDLAHRFKLEDFREIDWMTGVAIINESPNFRTQADGKEGLLFRNKRDRKMIDVNPNVDDHGDFTTRKEI